MESSINERINSQLYSDVVNSYVDINSITSTRNIVPGSYKESIQQCQDQTLSTLNAAGGQTLFTRLLLSPTIRNATLAQLTQIFFQYVIKSGTLGIIKGVQSTETAAEITQTTNTNIAEHLRFKLFYDSGASIASMIQLCLVADSKISTENFNYQQTLLTLNSIPDYATQNSLSESTLSGLVENENCPGVGSGVIDVKFTDGQGGDIIAKDIVIEGNIDLNKSNPLFHNFPIITRNMGQLYIRLYMENFLRELKIVYLNKTKNPATCTGSVNITFNKDKFTIPKGVEGYDNWQEPTNNDTPGSQVDGYIRLSGTANNVGSVNITTAGAPNYLPYQRLPADKPDFVYLDGKLFKVRLVIKPADATKITTAGTNFNDSAFKPIYTLNDGILWTRFEIRKPEFDIEDYEDIKASQAKAGVYKFPVHMWRSKNFDQTNAASSSANALQTTLNAPNIDRLFITQPWNSNYYTFLPTVSATDINPQLYNNPVLPRTEDCLNIRTVERIGSVFVDTDKHSIPADLFNSLFVPTLGKQLHIKGLNTYGGESAFTYLQRNSNTSASLSNSNKIFIPNKFAYGLELNAGGCFRRGYNSVIDGMYSPTVPINLQQSVQTSADIYKPIGASVDDEKAIVDSPSGFVGSVAYGDLRYSGAVASVHCLCDYIFWISFDSFGNMVDFGCSEYNDRN